MHCTMYATLCTVQFVFDTESKAEILAAFQAISTMPLPERILRSPRLLSDLAMEAIPFQQLLNEDEKGHEGMKDWENGGYVD